MPARRQQSPRARGERVKKGAQMAVLDTSPHVRAGQEIG
jgi:hypothetical protein